MQQFKVGDRVRFKGVGAACHVQQPRFYPQDGTIGTIIFHGIYTGACVQWPEGSTSRDDKWWVFPECLELVADDPT